MNAPLFNFVAGTGGIGAGRLFELDGDHTLGRSESRLARFTEYRDYCKLHIIFHYIAVFLRGKIPVYAIGHVGADEEGRALRAEMEKAGINVLHVTEDANNPTMYSVCGQYPGGEGFNITANNSACQTVGTEDVDRFFNDHGAAGHGIVVAAPEVPMNTRLHLLRKGKEKECFNAVAVPSGEVLEFTERGGVALTDLIALNQEEAQAFASLSEKDTDPKGPPTDTEEEKLDRCVNYLQSINPEITVIITLGAKGALVRYKDHSHRSEAIDIPVINTAGAGDCFLGTIVAAKARGMDIFSAMDIGIAASNRKVGCKDTIDFSISLESLEKFAREHGIFFSDEVLEAFFDRR